MKPPDQRRQNVAVLRVEVVARAVQVGWHDATVVSAVLPVVTLAQLDAGDLGDRVGLVGGLEIARQQRIFAHGLGHYARINARRSQEQQLTYADRESLMNDVALDHQVFVDELGRIGVIGMNATHLRRS